MTKRGGEKIAGCLEARHSFEALHNARIEAMGRGGDVRALAVARLD